MSLRITTPESFEAWAPFRSVIGAAFGEIVATKTNEEIRLDLALKPLDFRIGVVDGNEILGGCEASEFEVSMPGGGAISASALRGVGIDPTKTGRGGLRVMMEEHLRRTKERGLAASTLLASESGLYDKFGYGIATTMASYEIDSARGAFVAGPVDDGTLELITDVGSAAGLLGDVYARTAKVVAGTASRSSEWWEVIVGKTNEWLGGGEQLGVIHRNAANEPDGYMLYKVKARPDWVADNIVLVNELVAGDLTAELRLFQFACRIPLTRTVRWTQAPVDPSIRHHLADPRQLRTVDQHDLLWLRPVDVVRLLESRAYLSDGSITIEVDDPLFADQRGPWNLSVSGGVATVVRSDDQPALVLTPSQLGCVVLGDTRVLELKQAGLISGDDVGVTSFDRLMLTERRPFNLSKF